MADERTLPKLPPRHPPIQPNTVPDQPKAPIAPGPKPKQKIGKREQIPNQNRLHK
jgi:hypothetical protein